MSSRAVKNKLPRIIFLHRPSSRGGAGSVFVHWAKMIIDDSCEDEPLMALSNDPHSRPHACWTECVFFLCVAVGHSHIQKQRSEAIVQLQTSQQKEATFCPRRPTFTTGRLHKLQQGLCTRECARHLCIHMHWSISAWCVVQPNTTWACHCFQVFFFRCCFSHATPPIFTFLFRTKQQGTGWEESLNPGYVYTLIFCNCVWACN